MKLQIGRAAQLAGVSRSAMHRALKSGKLSYTTDERGTRWVDQSELARAYPDTARSEPRNEARHVETHADDRLVEHLMRQIADLQAERDRLLSIIEREPRQLAAPSWWRRWRG